MNLRQRLLQQLQDISDGTGLQDLNVDVACEEETTCSRDQHLEHVEQSLAQVGLNDVECTVY